MLVTNGVTQSVSVLDHFGLIDFAFIVGSQEEQTYLHDNNGLSILYLTSGLMLDQDIWLPLMN